MPKNTQLEIAAASARGNSPEHKRFKGLLAKIDKARERLASWQQQLPLFAQMHAERVDPVLEKLHVSRRAWAFELEAVLAAQRWSKVDAASIGQMICELAGALLDSREEPDAELKDLYNRHADIDFDSEEQQHLDSMKLMLEKMGGVELGDAPVESVEDLMRRAHEQLAGQMQEGQENEARHSAPKRPAKPARKTAAQKRAEEDASRISQTVREVYRKLASALHPDRVAADAPQAERESATALMQRVNSAYEAGDLLALLTIQLQIEQVDIHHAAGIAAEQVRHFNKVLTEQLRELELEIYERQHAFCASYGLMTAQRIDPRKLGMLLDDEMRDIASAQARIDHDRRTLRGDPALAKRFLKRWRQEQRAAEFDELFF